MNIIKKILILFYLCPVTFLQHIAVVWHKTTTFFLAQLGLNVCANDLNCTHLIVIIYFLVCRWRWTGFRCSRHRWCPCLWTSSHYARMLNCTSQVYVTLNLWRVCLQTGPEWNRSPLTSLGHRTQGRSISLSVTFSQLRTFPQRWVSRKICVLESLF